MAKKTGFTLIECLLVLSMAIILIAVSFPVVSHFLNKNRGRVAVNQIISAVRYARFMAVSYDQPVVLCKSRNHRQCGGAWRDGQIVMLVKTGKVLRYFHALPPGLRVVWRSSFGKNNYLQLLPSGFTNGQQGGFRFYRDSSTTPFAKITINNAGRIR